MTLLLFSLNRGLTLGLNDFFDYSSANYLSIILLISFEELGSLSFF